MSDSERLKLCHSRALRTWLQYLGFLAGWAAVLLLVLGSSTLLAESLTWQPDALYEFLYFIKKNIFVFYTALLLAGWVVISYFYIARPIRDLELLSESTDALAHPGDAPIRLPDSLHSAENRLNLVREQALRSQQAARDAEQRKNDLVVYLAHDLKTPLTSVIGYLTLLRDEPELSAAARARYTGVALDKAQRLEDLINEFFDITRFSLSHLELERQSVDMKRMLEQVVSEFEPALRQKSIRCELDLPPEFSVVCDPDKMARVFDNLLNNAAHYAYPDSVVRIQGKKENQSAVLTFQNAGRTIPPDKLNRMFDQFFRLDTSRATDTGNAGLGLAIAREIVEAHGGTIEAQSEQEKIRFVVTLPLR